MQLAARVNRIAISPTSAVLAAAEKLRAQGADLADFGPGQHFVEPMGEPFGGDFEDALGYFGAFQRLHKDTEFEGSGVGLALVRLFTLGRSARPWPRW